MPADAKKKQALKGRIEGFGNEPMPPPVNENPVDRLMEDAGLMNWWGSARDSVNAMLDVVDDTVNAMADAVDDTISAIIGEDDDPPPEGYEQQGDAPSGRTSNRREGGHADSDDEGEEPSNVDFEKVVAEICTSGGDLEEFVMAVRGMIKTDADEKKFGVTLTEQLLNEVQQEATLRTLHVMKAVVADDNLALARDVVRSRAATKLKKLQATAMFASVAKDILGGAKASASSSEKKNGEAKKQGTPAPTENLLDLAAPATSSSSTSAVAPKQDMEDLLGFGDAPAASPAAAATGPVPALAPPPGATAQRGQRVSALWAGDGKLYPALVETVRGQTVTVRWLRRGAADPPGQAFVCDVGDDSLHESLDIKNVHPLGSGSSRQRNSNDLVDLDTPVAASEAAAPPLTGNLQGLDFFGGSAGSNAPAPVLGSSAPAPAAGQANFANFQSAGGYNAAAGAGPKGMAAMQASGVTAASRPPPVAAAATSAPAEAPKTSLDALSGIGALSALPQGAEPSFSVGAPAPKPAPKPKAEPKVKGEIKLDDAFAVTAKF
eukprot:TRINITY_DN26561_c0_g1_i1.p1 TRINITY_DN26561_c0_g1~~TRINITY_DN26561_c0_g1_i1.p1  ORF type:complete len:549 (+),score=165.77 TRINITY_DN26561_c0_g1_i1:108-1754(+)